MHVCRAQVLENGLSGFSTRSRQVPFVHPSSLVSLRTGYGINGSCRLTVLAALARLVPIQVLIPHASHDVATMLHTESLALLHHLLAVLSRGCTEFMRGTACRQLAFFDFAVAGTIAGCTGLVFDTPLSIVTQMPPSRALSAFVYQTVLTPRNLFRAAVFPRANHLLHVVTAVGGVCCGLLGTGSFVIRAITAGICSRYQYLVKLRRFS